MVNPPLYITTQSMSMMKLSGNNRHCKEVRHGNLQNLAQYPKDDFATPAMTE